jgi:hypothetical protein
MHVELSIEPGSRIILAQLIARLLSGKPISLLQNAYRSFLTGANRDKLLFSLFVLPGEDPFAELEPLYTVPHAFGVSKLRLCISACECK